LVKNNKCSWIPDLQTVSQLFLKSIEIALQLGIIEVRITG
jgi:hypothetical protein